MDQEECSSEQSQRKSVSRSAARHLRRKRLNDARRIEKQLAALTNGASSDTGQPCEPSPESVSKSKARRLRKRNKRTEQEENGCSPSEPDGPTATTPVNGAEVPTENGTQEEGEESVTKPKSQRRPRKRNRVKEGENNCCYCNDSSVSVSGVEETPAKCAGSTDAIDGTIDTVDPVDTGLVTAPKEQCTEEKLERLINHVKTTGRKVLVAPDTKPGQIVGSLEDLSELSYCSESSGLIKTEHEPQQLPPARHDEIAEEKLTARLTQPTESTPEPATVNYRVADPRPDDESFNTSIETSCTPTVASSSEIAAPGKMTDKKGTSSEKSKDEIKAEREAKKAAKAAAKAKAKAGKSQQEKENKPEVPVACDPVTTTEPKHVESSKPEMVEQGQNDAPATTGNVETSDSKAERSKAELRAQRRAKQEAQRAAKQQQLTEKSKPKSKEPAPPQKATAASAESPRKVAATKKPVQREDAHEVNLFKHLYHERELACKDVAAINSSIHPVIVKLGAEYANKIIVGSNSRCVALLAAVKQLIEDFERPPQADFTRSFEAKLQEAEAYLHHCRPLAVSMQNAIRHLKWQMTKLPPTLSDEKVKSALQSAIDTYIREQIELAGIGISQTIQKKISDGDVILTYGHSTLIHNIMLDAHKAGKKFRVIVVDGRPFLEGKELLKRLAEHGLDCSYILINALSCVMPEVSKVFLGAHAILANGAVMSRVGTAQVALMARAFNVPVLVACETHKSCERGQTDSIVYNELGTADDLARDSGSTKKSLLANWRTKKSLNLLNITYDVTPADLVTAVVTELAILPCTSVPVILRIRPSEIEQSSTIGTTIAKSNSPRVLSD